MTTRNISDLAPLFGFLRLKGYLLFLCLGWGFIFGACSFGYITLDDGLIDTLTVISFGYLMIGNIAYLVIKDEHSSQGILKFRTSIILGVFFLRVMVTVFIFISMSIGSFIMSAIYDGSYLVFFLSFSFFVAVLFSWIGLNTFLRKSYDNSIKDILSLGCKLDSISELLALEEQSIEEILILSEMIHEKILFLVRFRYFLVPLSNKQTKFYVSKLVGDLFQKTNHIMGVLQMHLVSQMNDHQLRIITARDQLNEMEGTLENTTVLQKKRLDLCILRFQNLRNTLMR